MRCTGGLGSSSFGCLLAILGSARSIGGLGSSPRFKVTGVKAFDEGLELGFPHLRDPLSGVIVPLPSQARGGWSSGRGGDPRGGVASLCCWIDSNGFCSDPLHREVVVAERPQRSGVEPTIENDAGGGVLSLSLVVIACGNRDAQGNRCMGVKTRASILSNGLSMKSVDSKTDSAGVEADCRGVSHEDEGAVVRQATDSGDPASADGAMEATTEPLQDAAMEATMEPEYDEDGDTAPGEAVPLIGSAIARTGGGALPARRPAGTLGELGSRGATAPGVEECFEAAFPTDRCRARSGEVAALALVAGAGDGSRSLASG